MEDVLSDLGPLYHNYSLFGVNNQQLPGIYELNQKSKEKIILAYIQYALAKCCVSTETKATFIELFCADGYYAMAARWFGAYKAYGLDDHSQGGFAIGDQIVARLGIDNIFFIKGDVNKIDSLPGKDIVANVGGLYHVSNPEEMLEKSYDLATRYLIVQSVVSLATTDPSYFQTPAPGWTWGCRYSRNSFDSMIRNKGWKIIDSHFNELEGNSELRDRGSVYYLIEK